MEKFYKDPGSQILSKDTLENAMVLRPMVSVSRGGIKLPRAVLCSLVLTSSQQQWRCTALVATCSGPLPCDHSPVLQDRKWKYMSKKKACSHCRRPCLTTHRGSDTCVCHSLFSLALTAVFERSKHTVQACNVWHWTKYVFFKTDIFQKHNSLD